LYVKQAFSNQAALHKEFRNLQLNWCFSESKRWFVVFMQ